MGHSVALNFEDGVTRFIECTGNETVGDASYRVGINIPLDCRDGACGTCKSFVESGTYESGDYIEDALTDEEAAAGLALACQIKPRGAMVLDILASSLACKTKGQTVQARLVAVEPLSDTSYAVTLDGDGPIAFLPGQYVNVLVPGTDQRRSYSFSSPPESATQSFLVRDIAGGVMSTYLRERARPGDALTLDGPAGSFYLREIKRPLLLLAGGTGLAPFLSMLPQLAQSTMPIHLVYGVTHDADLVLVDRLERALRPGFTYATVVAAETSAHPRRGYVMSQIEQAHLNGGDVDIYLCGPPPMVDAVRAWLGEQGVTPAQFYAEKFSPSGAVAIRAAA